MVVEGEGWTVLGSLPCASLPYSQPGACYILLPIPEDIMASTGEEEVVVVVVVCNGCLLWSCFYLPYLFPFPFPFFFLIPFDTSFPSLPSGTLSATLKFTVRDCDPATGEPDTDEGYEDDYTVSGGGGECEDDNPVHCGDVWQWWR